MRRVLRRIYSLIQRVCVSEREREGREEAFPDPISLLHAPGPCIVIMMVIDPLSMDRRGIFWMLD